MQKDQARNGANKLRSLLAIALTTVSTPALQAQAWAQTGQASSALAAERDFDIPAQPLASALLRFAEQADLQILYAQEDVQGLHANAVRGRLTPNEALARLLPANAPRIEIAADQLVRVGASRPQRDAPERVVASDELLVTGTRIRGAAPAGSHVLTLDETAIAATGRSTLQDVLHTLPQNFAGSQNEFTQQGSQDARRNLTFGSTVDLRGLGADATLTLVNGRRLAPAGQGNFVDISTIPLSAVRRIEVLADGASAIYGSDAVGGVVNIILNDDYEGAESRVRVGATSQGGASEFGASHLVGANWRRGRFTAAYDYRQRDRLAIDQRDFLASSDFRDRGGTNFSRTFANPGNITRIGATSVNLAIPRGQDGLSLSAADLVAGDPNYTDLNVGAWLLPKQTSHALFLSGRQEVARGLDLFADAIAGVREADARRENLAANLTVPESNYYRQLNSLFLGQGPMTVQYNMGADLGPIRIASRSEAYSGVLGLRYELGAGWRVEASAALARSGETIDGVNYFDSSTIAPFLASGSIDTAFNPFADGSNTPQAVLDQITFAIHTATDAETRTYTMKADGPLWSAPGGVWRAALGLERREERFDVRRVELHNAGDVDQFLQDAGARRVDAVFAELYAPLVGPHQNLPLVRDLALSLSVRSEEASDYGGEPTPKIGLNWRLTDGLAVRASWGQSFKGPNFQQMLSSVSLSYQTATAAQDPLADNGSTGILTISGSNRNLRPERADIWTAGIDWRPPSIRGLSASAAYFDIQFNDRIAVPAATFTIIRDPTGLESIFFRDPTPEQIAHYMSLGPPPTGALPADGIEAIVDRRLVNLAGLDLRGIDLAANYALDTDWGQFGLFASASHLLQFEVRTFAGATPINQLDTLNNQVDWRARAGASWTGAHAGAAFSVAYVDDYHDRLSLPNRRIKSFTTWDMRLTYDFAGRDARGPSLSFNIQNLFDADPPFANNATGFAFDAANASPLGRVVSLELRQAW